MNTVEMHAIVHGKVQGVFFRDTAKQKASDMGISGTVENLPDGTVEIYAVGNKNDLQSLISYLTGEEGPGHVDDADLSFDEPSRTYDEFRVIS